MQGEWRPHLHCDPSQRKSLTRVRASPGDRRCCPSFATGTPQVMTSRTRSDTAPRGEGSCQSDGVSTATNPHVTGGPSVLGTGASGAWVAVLSAHRGSTVRSYVVKKSHGEAPLFVLRRISPHAPESTVVVGWARCVTITNSEITEERSKVMT